MATRWVDIAGYFGPDRRRRSGKRLLDRRRHDEAGEPPPLAAMLRRLRVRLGGVEPEDRRHALDILKAAIMQSRRLGWLRCTEALMRIDDLLSSGGDDASAAADALILEALEHAAFRR